MEEPYVCYWDVHPESDIRVCTNGEVEGTIVKYKNKYVVRKKKGNKRYEVGRLILLQMKRKQVITKVEAQLFGKIKINAITTFSILSGKMAAMDGERKATTPCRM